MVFTDPVTKYNRLRFNIVLLSKFKPLAVVSTLVAFVRTLDGQK